MGATGVQKWTPRGALRNKTPPTVSMCCMDWRVRFAQHAAQRSVAAVHRQMVRGLYGLATVAATAPFVGILGTVWGIFNSFPGCSGDRWTCIAAVANLLSRSMMPAAWGLALAVTASSGYRHLSARMADFDAEMENAVRDLSQYLATCRVGS